MADYEFWDGFDAYNTGVGEGVAAAGYLIRGGTPTVTYPTGRVAGRCLRINNYGGAEGAGFTRSFASPSAQFSMAGAFRLSWLLSAANGLLGPTERYTYQNVDGAHCGANVTGDGRVQAIRRTGSSADAYTVLASSDPGLAAPDQWFHLAVCGEIHDSTGRLKIALNGEVLHDLTGVDTRNGGTGVAIAARAGTWYPYNATGDCDIDDFVTRDDDQLIPDLKSWPSYGNADGGTLNWTPSTGATHYGVIDESQVSQTDYLSATTVGDVDEIGLTDLPYTPASIKGVAVRGFGMKTDALSRAVAYGIKSGATVYDGPTFYLPSSLGQDWHGTTTDPNTSAAWTAAAVNSLLLRPKVIV